MNRLERITHLDVGDTERDLGGQHGEATDTQQAEVIWLPRAFMTHVEVEEAEKTEPAVIDQTDFEDTIPKDAAISLQKRLAEQRRARNANDAPVSDGPKKNSVQGVATNRRTNGRLAAVQSDKERSAQQARDQLVERYLALARSIAMKYAGGRESIDDLVQVANLGLLKAATRFDETKGVAFSSFAVPTIQGEIKRHFRDHTWGMHVSRGMQERALKIGRVLNRLESTGKDFSLRDVAREAGVSEEDALDGWMALREGLNTKSLDAPINTDNSGDDDARLVDIAPSQIDEESVIDDVAHSIEVGKILSRLSPRDREVFLRHIVLDQTQKETSEAVGISQMHVSRIVRAIKSETYLPKRTRTPKRRAENS